MSDLTKRVARAICVAPHDPDDINPPPERVDSFGPEARAAIREVLAEQEAWADNAEDPDFFRQGLREFARVYGIEP